MVILVLSCRNLLRLRKPSTSAEPATKFKSTVVLPYVKGLSEQLRRYLQQQGVRAVFKSDTTLRSQLVRLKDAVDPAKQDGVVYRILSERGKVYMGEIGTRGLEDLCKTELRSMTETSDLPVPRPPPFQDTLNNNKQIFSQDNPSVQYSTIMKGVLPKKKNKIKKLKV